MVIVYGNLRRYQAVRVMESSLNHSLRRRHSIKEKLEQLKRDQSAITIQTIWRGRSERKKFSKYHQSHNERMADNSSVADKGHKEVSTIAPKVADKSTVSIEDLSKSVVDKVPDEEDDEDEIIAADEEEQNLDIEASSEISSPLSPAKWPEPFKEDFSSESWPIFDGNDDAIEDWVYRNRCLYIRIVTWNLCAKKPPPVDLVRQKLLPKKKFHIYIIGSEECERSIAQSAVNTSKKNWEAYLMEALGADYQPIRAQTLQAIHVIIFVHKSISYLCSDVSSGVVPTGIGNTLGNKGAVGVSFSIGNTNIVVVNAHLAAHQNAVKQRNLDFNKINKEMPYALRPRTTFRLARRRSNDSVHLTKSKKEMSQKATSLKKQKSVMTSVTNGANNLKQSASVMWKSGLAREGSLIGGNLKSLLRDPTLPSSLSNFGDRVLFMGDLNYRIRGNRYDDMRLSLTLLAFKYVVGQRICRAAVSSLIGMNLHEVMINNDQLKNQIKRIIKILHIPVHAYACAYNSCELLSTLQINYLSCTIWYRWSMKHKLAFQDFTEPPITFKPTYKLDRNSDEYDTGMKKRIPAWTDRILYIDRGITCLAYNADMSLKTSDHRPVYASFKVDIDLDEDDILNSLNKVTAIKNSIPEDDPHNHSNALSPISNKNTPRNSEKKKLLELPRESKSTKPSINSNNKIMTEEFQSKSAVCTMM